MTLWVINELLIGWPASGFASCLAPAALPVNLIQMYQIASEAYKSCPSSICNFRPSLSQLHRLRHPTLLEAYQDIKTPTNQTQANLETTVMASATAAVPATCCGREGGCICAKEAKCSCGKQAAMHCNCEKAQTENVTTGARCSCSTFMPTG